MPKLLISLLILLSVQQSAFADSDSFSQTVYVATVNELNRALQKANQMGGNTDIVLADGQYQINQRLQITASHIQLRSASGAPSTVILSGQGMKKSSSVELLIDASCSHTSLSGSTFATSDNQLLPVRHDK